MSACQQRQRLLNLEGKRLLGEVRLGSVMTQGMPLEEWWLAGGLVTPPNIQGANSKHPLYLRTYQREYFSLLCIYWSLQAACRLL